jgi:hypothetical protein
VQVVLTVAVLVVVPSPVRPPCRSSRSGSSRRRPAVGWRRACGPPAPVPVGAVATLPRRDLRDGLLARRAWPAIALASALSSPATRHVPDRRAHRGRDRVRRPDAAAGAARAAGAALPNVGGWGPREGVTAWTFAAAGLGASLGVATAVAYGVMVFVASLPGRRGSRGGLGPPHPVGAAARAATSRRAGDRRPPGRRLGCLTARTPC